MRVDTGQLKVVQKHDLKGRYRQFVKLAGERKQVWGLYLDGWALSRDEGSQSTSFLLWHERDVAERFAKGAWRGYEATEIPLDDLVEQLLPQLARDGLKVCLNAAVDDPGLAPSIAQLILDLEHEADPSASEDDD